jgi:glucokinase
MKIFNIFKYLKNKKFIMVNIGLDIGGTNIKSGIVYNNKIIKKVVIKTGKTKQQIIQNIISSIEQLDCKNIDFIGVGCPGPADYEKGVILKTPNIPLNGVNIKKILQKKFCKNVKMNNDANCFALGESIRLKKMNVIGLTLGTGVGGGIIINNKIYSGKGNAGELGHCTINFKAKKSRCGNNGCLEEYISKRAIIKNYHKDPDKLRSKKDWDEIGTFLGIGITNLANTFDPDMITIGGGISNSFNFFQKKMNHQIKKRALNKVKVVKGSQDSGILGAANL